MILRRRAERIFERLEPAGGDDTRRVMDAARALDIKEFDLFRLAWRHWHGDDGRPETIERAFGRYMMHGRVPPWVRQFARDVMRLKGNGTLDPLKFGVALVWRQPPPPPRHARLIVAAFALIACGFVALLISTPNDSVNRPGPGCANAGTGGNYAGRVARLFTGRADPFDCRNGR